MSNIHLENSIDSTISKLENDIKNISDILINIHEAVLTLDESKWNTKEKKKMEEEFLPYLEKISLKYPLYLNNHLSFLKDAIEKYRVLDNDYKKIVEDTL